MKKRCAACTMRGVCPNCPESRRRQYVARLEKGRHARCLTVAELVAALETMPRGARVRFMESTNPEAVALDVESVDRVVDWERRFRHPEAAVLSRLSGLRRGEVALWGSLR